MFRNKSVVFFPFLFLLGLFLCAQSPVEVVIQTGHYDDIRTMAFSPDGKYLASGGKDGKVIIWDLTTGKQFRELKAHSEGTQGVTCVIFSNDGEKIIAGGDRQNDFIIAWDWLTGDTAWIAEDVFSGKVESMEVSPDGKYLAAGTYRSMAVLELETGKEVWKAKGRGSYNDLKIKHTVDDFDFSKDSKKLLYCFENVVHIVDALTGEILFDKRVRDENCDVQAVAFGPKEKTIYATGNNKDFTVWDIASQEVVRRFEMPTGSRPCPCTFTEDATTYFGACNNILSLDPVTGETNFLMKREWIHWIKSFAVSKDGKTFAVAGNDKENNTAILIYNAKNQQKIRMLQGFPGGILSLDFNQDGSMLASGSDERHPRVWDFKSSKGYTNYSEDVIGEGDVYATVRFGPKDDQFFLQHPNVNPSL